MTEHTQLIDAINIRTSHRAYDDEPLDDDVARQLEMALQPINLLADLNIKLVRDQPSVFAEANASGHLKNAANLLVLVGPEQDDEALERAGFYGERMVLTATLRGLGTLWVGGSWDKAEAVKHCRVARGQEAYLGIVLGYPEHHADYQSKSYEQLAEIQRTHRTSKTYEQFTAGMSDEARETVPAWFRSGVEAAMKAPSGMNRQPVTFTYDADADTAAAHLSPEAGSPVDLGIAKLHFQIGAGQGQWAWGNGGLFVHR